MDEMFMGSNVSYKHMGLTWQIKQYVDFEPFGLGFWIIRLIVF